MTYEFVPIDLSRESFSTTRDNAISRPLQNLKQRLRQQNIENLPQGLQDLPFTNTISQLVSIEAAISLGLPVASGEAGHNRSIFVQQYQRYQTLEEDDERIPYGVGIRWTVDISKTDAHASINTLSMLTASAQLGYVTANVRFDVIGLLSEEIDSAIPTPTMLNVETHVEYAKAMKAIMSLMWKQNTVVKPQVLSIPTSSAISLSNSHDQALALAWALRQIADGKSLSDALSKAKTSQAQAAVKGVYFEVAGISVPEKMPDSEAKRVAKEKLSSWT